MTPEMRYIYNNVFVGQGEGQEMSPAEPRESMIANGAAEAVGTFILVFAGTAIAVAASLGRPIAGAPLDSLAVGLTFALALTAIVAAFGHTSGAHVNPAVTLGLAVMGKFPWAWVPVYWISQLVGAILASLAVWLTFGDAARGKPALGATMPTSGTTDIQAFVMEMIVTFILVFVVAAVATDRRANAVVASIAIGFALGVAVLVAGPVSGGSANPARTLGPMIVSGQFTGVWIYILAPLVGGAIAAGLYTCCIGRAKPPEP